MTKQAHSEVFYGVGVIQLGDRPNKAGGEALVVSDRIAQQVCNWGGGSPGTH